MSQQLPNSPRVGIGDRFPPRRALLVLVLGVFFGTVRVEAQSNGNPLRVVSTRGSGQLCPRLVIFERRPLVFALSTGWHPSTADGPARCTIEVELELEPGSRMESVSLAWEGAVTPFSAPTSSIALSTSYRVEGAGEPRTTTYQLVNDDFEANHYRFTLIEQIPASTACSSTRSKVRITAELQASLLGPDTPGQSLSLATTLNFIKSLPRPCAPSTQP
jgi:hypothetical protein